MNLDELEARLMPVMRDADLRTVLVINSTNPDTYVQFLIDELGRKGLNLLAQVNGLFIPPNGEQQLTDAGFQIDTSMPGRLWYRQAPWPVPSATLREMAHAMCQALTDSGISDTTNLTYRAWRDPEPRPDAATGEELDALDRGQNPLPVPDLGLPAATR